MLMPSASSRGLMRGRIAHEAGWTDRTGPVVVGVENVPDSEKSEFTKGELSKPSARV